MALAKIGFVVASVCILFVSGAEFTKEEQEALLKFRPFVESIVYQNYMSTDDYLITWLRARDLDLEKAKAMLEKNIQWRKENNIDGIMDEDLSSVEDCLKIQHGGKDREGRPILYTYVGDWDTTRCIHDGKLEKVTRYAVQKYMEGVAREVRTLTNPNDGSNVTQHFSILDVAGFSFEKGGCLSCLGLFTTWTYYYETYYPQSVFKFFIVNNVPAFSAVGEIAAPIHSPYTTNNALAFYGTDRNEWTQALKKFVDDDNMPPFKE